MSIPIAKVPLAKPMSGDDSVPVNQGTPPITRMAKFRLFNTQAGALAVTFTDQSGPTPSSWAWSFGDGGTSTLQNPVHTYAIGTFSPQLVVVQGTTTSTASKSAYIVVTGT